MIFRGRFDKQMEHLREQNRDKLANNTELENVTEKGDVLAMILSAMLVILPTCLIALAVVAALGYFFVVR